MSTETDDDSELSEFEAGFLTGYFTARGYSVKPTIEQFKEAVEVLALAREFSGLLVPS